MMVSCDDERMEFGEMEGTKDAWSKTSAQQNSDAQM